MSFFWHYCTFVPPLFIDYSGAEFHVNHKKLGSKNQQRWSYCPLRFLKLFKNHNRHAQWTPLFRQPCWKIFYIQVMFYALSVQGRPVSHMLSIKNIVMLVLSRLKSMRTETTKTKQENKKENSFVFNPSETDCLKKSA